MHKLEVFDPPMCCPTGVCGPAVDPALVRFAGNVAWLKANGVEVERFNLSQDPGAFAENPVVASAMESGRDSLPLILVDGKLVAERAYPEREALAQLVGLAAPQTIYTDAVQELVAIGAAVAANCEACFRFHYDKARKLGVSKDDMARAVAMAAMVKESPARSVLELAERYLGVKLESARPSPGCCTPGGENPASVPEPDTSTRKCC